MRSGHDGPGCGQCGIQQKLCHNCHNCEEHCLCNLGLFDADELGLDPESDNNPEDPSRHA